MKLLSIIVPVYNVEKYIKPCIGSILQQKLNEDCYEIIIINDGTKDGSMEMISDITNQHQNIRIINQDNQGLSVARNNGVAIAKGEYILFLDSDDLLIEDSLKRLLKIALENKVDLVVTDFYTMSDKEIEERDNHFPEQSNIQLLKKTGEQLFLQDLDPLKCCVWRTLYRKDYLINNQISFVPGILYEDVPYTHECYLCAQRCIRTDLVLNIYRKRTGSLTPFDISKSKDYCISIAKTWELTQKEDLSSQILTKLKDNVYTIFSLFIYLLSLDNSSFSEKEKIIRHLKGLVPDMSFQNGIKQKIYTFLYRNTPIILLYSRKLYGIIYEDLLHPFYYHYIKKLT